MSYLLEDLTPSQQQAVTTIEGPLLVLAGAGSGKTRVITRRIAYMIESGIKASAILAITFTNKAAKEMVERVTHLVAGQRPHVSTFHSFCARVLRQSGTYAGLDTNFVIYDTSDSRSLIKSCILALNFDPKSLEVSTVAHYISYCKNQLIPPEELEKHLTSKNAKEIAMVFKKYQEELLKCNAADFDDLLLLVLKIFSEYPQVLNDYQERYRYLLVDEYQDTNLPQHQLIKVLGSKYKNICVTGDPDQTIYSWRGANIANINSFPDEYVGCPVVTLEQNFRSTNTILKAANALISKNPLRYQKNLFSNLGEGEKLTFDLVQDENEESKKVVSYIERLVRNSVSLKNIAIFYRTNGQSRAIEEILKSSSFAYTIVGGTKFYDRAEIKDMVAFLRLLENGRDAVSLSRVINTPTRGLGAKAVQTIKDLADSLNISMAEALTHEGLQRLLSNKALSGVRAFLTIFSKVFELGETASVAEKISAIYQASGYQEMLQSDETENYDRIANIESLFNAAVEFAEKTGDRSVSGFLENIALISDVDNWDDKDEKITLMTLHSAKGLEFDHVFMIGCEEGLLPHKNNAETEHGVEEERRLCYVGITRARKTLALFAARMRKQWGSVVFSRKSRFLLEIPETLFADSVEQMSQKRKGFSFLKDWESEQTTSKPQPIKPERSYEDEDQSQEMVVVKQGDMVRHPQFGKGIITKVDGEDEEARISVIFENFGVKTLIAQYSHLKKI